MISKPPDLEELNVTEGDVAAAKDYELSMMHGVLAGEIAYGREAIAKIERLYGMVKSEMTKRGIKTGE